MHEKEIDCISVGKVKPRQKRGMFKKIGKAVIDTATVIVSVIGAGCLAGIGFGWGLALIAAWF